MIPVLRPYQVTCVQQGLYFFSSERIQKPRIIVAPTAAGKSIIVAAIAKELTKKVLVIQPSKELLIQNYNKYLLYDNNVAAYSASVGKRELAKVTFATIGTIISVPKLFEEFECLIIDECHLYPNNDESMFKTFLDKNPQMKILGLTATPFRLRSSQSGSILSMLHSGSHIFREYQHIIQIQDIAEKYWANIDYVLEENVSNILKVNTTGADYTEKSLELYGKSVNKQIHECIVKFINDPMLLFVSSVDEAEKLAKKYPGSAYICSDQKKISTKERTRILQAFENGEIQRVFNFGILGVGYDNPRLMRLVDARPTLSLAKFYQMYGRLTRLHPDDPENLWLRKTYIDLAGNTARFGKIEDIEIRKIGSTYHIFSGEKQLTGMKMESNSGWVPRPKVYTDFEDMEITFGKFKGEKISTAPIWWVSWAMDNVNWNDKLVQNIRMFLGSKQA